MLCGKPVTWNRSEGFGYILGEDLSRIHGSTVVTRTPSTGFIYAVMGCGAPCVGFLKNYLSASYPMKGCP